LGRGSIGKGDERAKGGNSGYARRRSVGQSEELISWKEKGKW
jgi:hypothetical protein